MQPEKHQSPDEADKAIDAFFQKKPAQPAQADFLAKTLQAIEHSREEATLERMTEDDLETAMDDWLSAETVSARPTFAAEVCQKAIAGKEESPQDDKSPKILGFPSWVVTLGGLAAAVVFGMAAFIALFEQAYEDNAKRAVASIAEESAPAIALSSQPVPIDTVAASGGLELTTGTVLSEIETLLMMNDALYEVAALTDESTLQAAYLLMQ